MRLGGTLQLLREVGSDAVEIFENKPWTTSEDQFLDLFAFERLDT